MDITPALIADAVIVLGLLLAWWSGWRQGAWASVLSFVGISAGLVLGTAAMPFVMRLTDQVALRFLLALGVLVALVGLGQIVGAGVGIRVRDHMKARAQQRRDSAIGGLFQVVTMMLVTWLVSIPIANGLTGPVGQGVRESTILGHVNRYMPSTLSTLPAGIAAMLSESGLPPLVSPWLSQSSVEVAAPAIEVEDKEMVDSLRSSVIHVLGDADVCSRRLLGSGFVAQENYVITNAHVVAGTNVVALDTVLGMKEAQVVYYNPAVDIAVLYSPGLNLAPLQWANQEAVTGDDAIVMGYPQSGPFTASPARVREKLTIAGPDIYAQGQVEREAYTVRGSIRQGNSGGPLLNTRGEVIGVIFGASMDDTDTGYALTAKEVLGQIGQISSLTSPVDTGSCISR